MTLIYRNFRKRLVNLLILPEMAGKMGKSVSNVTDRLGTNGELTDKFAEFVRIFNTNRHIMP